MDLDQLPCSICPNQVFQSRKELVQHYLDLHNDKTCPYCSKHFATIHVLLYHLKTHVPRDDRPKFKCPIANCSKEYYSKWNLRLHDETIHSGAFSRYWCRTCGDSFPTKDDRDDHFQKVHNGLLAYQVTEYICPVDKCHKKYSVQYYLKRHLKSHHSSTPRIKLKCSHCSKEYSTKMGLKCHVQQFHSGPVKKYDCNLCDASLMSKAARDYHIVAKHTGEKSFQCRVCPAKFSSSGRLYAHGFVHAEERPHKCSICSKQFKQRSVLDQHTKQLHSDGRNRVTCPVCQITLSTKYSLPKHMKTHSREGGEFPCYFCKREFTQGKGLIDHLRSHTLEKPFVCSENGCQYSCSITRTLSRHFKREHLGNGGHSTQSKTMTCYFCSKVCYQSTQFVNHLRGHTLELPYPCPLCSTSFKSNAGLQQHIFTHTQEKPFSCRRCEKCFSAKSHLERHVTAIHN